MSERPHKLILLDMLDAIDGIETFVAGMSEQDYLADAKTQAAVERYLEILGEAANLFPESFYMRFNHIKWHRLISLRNRIIHAYFAVNDAIVWDIVTNYLPGLKYELTTILNNFDAV